MIQYVQGDILQADAEALVNTVNCVGVMGKGIALQFKNAFPDNFRAYAAACQRGEVQPGRLFVYDTGRLIPPRYIINFPTKRHWRGKSRIDDIKAGLAALVDEIAARGIRSVAIPPLGSGLGGLEWREVRPLIEQTMSALPDVQVQVFQPRNKAAALLLDDWAEMPVMTPGRAALIGLMARYKSALLDPTITLLEVHKLTYFLQAAGEPLRLRFVKATYGPYAENLRHVTRAMDGYWIAGYGDGSDVPHKQLTLVPGAMEDAEAFLHEHKETQDRFERVVSLVEGFETPVGLELLATVHWLMTEERFKEPTDLVRAVHEWAPGKRQFTTAQIELASGRLHSEGWL